MKTCGDETFGSVDVTFHAMDEIFSSLFIGN